MRTPLTIYPTISKILFPVKHKPFFIRKLLSIILFLICTVAEAQFTPGNIVVLQAGDGATALANTGNAIVLKEYNTTGTSTYSVGITTSTASGNPLIISGSATSEGGLSLTPNGKYLIFTGYAQTLPAASSLANGASSTYNRGIGVVNAAGSYSRVAVSSTFFSANNIRSATSDGLDNYWAAGANDGTNYYGTVSTATTIQNQNTNTRYISIFGGNIYFSASSGTLQGIAKIGSGLPVVSGQTTSSVISIGTGGSPYAFFFNSSQTICYIADDRAVASGGGIQKWVYASSTWSLAYTFGTGATVGARGVIADFSGSNPIIYATTAETSANRLISINDAGSTSTATTLATSGANTLFRGISFSPYCTSPQITSVISNSVICANQFLNLDVTTSGTAPFTYTWTGAGSFNSASTKSPSVTGAASGNYSVVVSNGCGINTGTTSVTVNSTPVITATASAGSVCLGQQTNLSGAGANTYTWSNGLTNGSNFTPTATTIYTVTGTDGNNCSNSATLGILVNPLPTITVNSATLCSGQTASLVGNGAVSYTWDSGSNTSSITPSPTLSTTYTLNGSSAAGCISSATTEISVNQTPLISSSGGSICTGDSFTLTANGATTYTWDNSSNTNSIVVSPTLTTSYSVAGTSTNNCSSSATLTLIVNSIPALNVSSMTICAGTSAVLSSSGAATYTWDSGSNSNSITLTPSVTTVYTVSGTSSAGCSGSTTAQIVVNANPTVNVNSATLCAGNSATLIANGAGSYTWNTGANTSSISITPTSTTIYTVTGFSLGCTGSATTNINVNPVPTLAVNSATLCAGNSASLNASGASTYTWNTGATTSSISVSPTTSTSYSLTGASLFGCISSATTQVFVNSLPTLSVNSATICNGSSAALTTSGTANSYTWNTGSNSSSISPTPTATSFYTVSASNSAGCIGSSTTQVLVNPNPTITLNSATLCAGNSATLTAGGAISYTWSDNSTSSTLVVSPSLTTSYTVTGASLGCTTSKTTSVTVNSLPSITSSSTSICNGSTATLTANGAATYSWSTGTIASSIAVSPTLNTTYTISGTSGSGCINTITTAVIVSTSPSITVNPVTLCAGTSTILTASGVSTYTWNTGATTSSISITPASTTVYTINGNASGCSAIASTTVVVTVNPLPIFTLNTSTICSGSFAALTTNGATTYTWNTGATSSSINISPITTTTYTVTGTLNGCVNSGTTLVTVNPLPTLSVNSATICMLSTVALLPTGAVSYTWNVGSSTPVLSVNPTTNTVYIVTGSSPLGCTSSATAFVTVLPLPSVTFTLGTSTTCQNDHILSLSALPAGGTFTGSGVNGTNFNPSVAGTGTFVITYTYQDANSCSNSANALMNVNACTGIEQFSKNSYAHVSPNPVQNELTVNIENLSEKCTIEVLNLSGIRLLVLSPMEKNTVIEMKDFANGLYIVRVINNGNCSMLKLIKH